MLGDPAAPSHDYAACSQAADFAVTTVDHPNESRFLRVPFVLDSYGGRVQSDANLISRTIQRAKVHSVSANPLERMRPRNRLRDQRLHNVPWETRVAVGKAVALD